MHIIMIRKIAAGAILAVAVSPTRLLTACASEDEYSYGYGVDASIPIHHNFFGQDSSISETLKTFGRKQIGTYVKFMYGCKERYGPMNLAHQCEINEEDRLRLNRDQPPRMTNYTDVGYKKIRLSEEIFNELKKSWDETMENGGIEALEEEHWPEANIYTNHWVSPSRMKWMNHLNEQIWNEVEERVKEWIPQASSFSRSSLYGVRVYPTGSILTTHVDRDPLITSAIINVGQDVDEDWPLEVYGHDGRAHNITMQPGDMVLYESHSVLHGRPFPLKGKYFANIFVHFKPLFEDEVDDVDKYQVGDEL